jgi:hypothetical protein
MSCDLITCRKGFKQQNTENFNLLAHGKMKSYPITCLDRPLGIQELQASRISRQSVGLTTLRTGRLYPFTL